MEDDGSRFEEKTRAAFSALAAEGIALEILTPSTYRVEGDPFLIGR
jgi:hypothetical protein